MAGAGLAGVGGLGYAGYVEPGWVEINRVKLALAGLAPQFEGYKLAHISDLHVDEVWMTRAQLVELAGLVNEQKPDLVCMTGDYVTHSAELFAEDLVAGLSRLEARDGVVAVLGNHDHWSGAGVVRDALSRGGVMDISNGVHTLWRDSGMLHMAGVDDVWMMKQRMGEVLEAVPVEGAAILLAHEPDFADESAATGRFGLQLSGHTHGGQVQVPFVGPLRLPPLGTKYHNGLYRVGEMLVYTNRGVGMVKPYVRFNCRPEVTVITLGVSG